MEHDQRNRKLAGLLIGLGAGILLIKLVGIFILVPCLLYYFGFRRLRRGKRKTGYILLGIATIILIENYAYMLGIIFILLGYYMMNTKKRFREKQWMQKENIIGSVKWTHSPWQLRSMNFWYVLGEVRLDLSMAIWEEEESTLVIQGVLGDIDVNVPEEIGLSVHSSVYIGQIRVGAEQESGIMNKVIWQSPHYDTAAYKLKLYVSYVVGDIHITRL